MVLATEIMLPPRRNSFNAPEPASKSPSSSPPASPPASPPKSAWWFFASKLKASRSYGGSIQTVATQKLRESKWFNQDEERLFCAVIESGFIVEIMHTEQPINENKSHFGVVSVENKKSKRYRTDLFCPLISYHLSSHNHLMFYVNPARRKRVRDDFFFSHTECITRFADVNNSIFAKVKTETYRKIISLSRALLASHLLFGAHSRKTKLTSRAILRHI